MNKRINELAQQAGFEFDPRDRNFYHSDSAQYINNELKKFAELIVRECMSLVSEPGPDMNDTERGILAQIKQHFGVEE